MTSTEGPPSGLNTGDHPRMTAYSSAPIHLEDGQGSPLATDQQMLLAVVDQLNVVTERLHALEAQIASGTVIINEPTAITRPAAPLRAVSNTSQSGWQQTF